MTPKAIDGTAIVYCEGAFATPNGKTAHGLARRSQRYTVACIVDSRYAGRDAGEVLDGKPSGIPVVASLHEALEAAERGSHSATHFVIGIAPDGGRLGSEAREAVGHALEHGLNVDSGLHDFISEDETFRKLAEQHGTVIRDVRKPPERKDLHFFTGCIEKVGSFRVAVLGTDSAVGKRTTAWMLVDALEAAGHSSLLIGTGQTAWLQGAEYSIVVDSIVSDFTAGEIENACCSAWKERRPATMVLEGQGSLMNPAYPGGFELLAAGRPHAVIMQHAPARKEYDGFPGYPIHPLKHQIQAIELISAKPVVAVTVNHEDLSPDQVAEACKAIERDTGLPTCDVLTQGAGRLVEVLKPLIESTGRS